MRVVFCGFDGVLHPRGAGQVRFGEVPARLFEWVDVLEALLAPHHDVFVVVHSAWRNELSPAELEAPLRQLRSRLLHPTARDPKYQAILQWLRGNPSVSAYRILDDEAKEFPQPPPTQLLLCHPESGIYDWRVRQQLREWLHQPSSSTRPLNSPHSNAQPARPGTRND